MKGLRVLGLALALLAPAVPAVAGESVSLPETCALAILPSKVLPSRSTVTL